MPRRKIKFCECGCGKKTNPRRGKPVRFIHGHAVRIQSKETRRKISKSLAGNTRGRTNKGRKHTKETKDKISKALKGREYTDEHRANLREAFKDRKPTKEHCRNISKSAKERFKDPTKHPLWRGGLSYLPYGTGWTSELRDSIRARDGYICQVCNEKQKRKTFHVHHIDYDKENNNESNLITLCKSCHMKTNGDREYWEEYFKDMIQEFI